MKSSMLSQLVGFVEVQAKFILHLRCTREKFYLGDFSKHILNISLCTDTYELISLKLGTVWIA